MKSAGRRSRGRDEETRALPRAAVYLEREKLRNALALRAGMAHELVGTDVVRVVDGEGDGLPGVVIDRYGPVLRVELWAQQWPADLSTHVDQLLRQTGAEAAVGVLRIAAGRSELRTVAGTIPVAHVVHENGMRFLVRVADKDAVGSGVFVDQRLGRDLVRRHARGRVVVNLFGHAGAFSVAAAVGGAARVMHVDAAKKCAPWAAANLALNGVDPRAHRFVVEDALKVLSRLAKRPHSAGIIICDPPTQAVRPDGTRFVARAALAEMARDAALALGPGGLLLMSTNDRDVSVEEVEDAVRQGVTSAGRSRFTVDELPLPADITSQKDARARPMRGVVIELA